MSKQFGRHARRWRAPAVALAVVACTTLAVIVLVPERTPPDLAEPTGTARIPPDAPSTFGSGSEPVSVHAPAIEGRQITPQARSDTTERPPLPAPNPIPDAYWQGAVEPALDSPTADGIDTSAPAEEAPAQPPGTASLPQSAPDPQRVTPPTSPPPSPADESDTAGAEAAPPRSSAPPAVSADERAALGRLYVSRAEHELRTGQRAAAAVSVERGLAADPRNPRLLNLRVMLRSATR